MPEEILLVKNKNYQNREWLDHQINILGKSKTQIAKECGVSNGVISHWSSNEESQKASKQYQLDHKEQHKIYCKQYYIKNRIKLLKDKKQYYSSHKEDKSEYDKIYRMNNESTIADYHKKYYTNNKIETLEFRKQEKIDALNILGGCKCEICGRTELSCLTRKTGESQGALALG